jgi:hypothetical protein
MTKKQSSILTDIEQLIKKTTEANKVFFSEGNRFVKNFDASSMKSGDLFENQKDLFSDAFNTFMKLNIQYASNLIDLGLAMTERMNQSASAGEAQEAYEKSATTSEPVFVLQVSGKPGDDVRTEFQLDSNKEEAIECQLVQTPYMMEQDPIVQKEFETTYNPQSFILNSGKPQKVKISIKIPGDAKQGDYVSNVQVLGYEQAFFSVVLEVLPATSSKKVTRKPKAKK